MFYTGKELLITLGVSKNSRQDTLRRKLYSEFDKLGIDKECLKFIRKMPKIFSVSKIEDYYPLTIILTAAFQANYSYGFWDNTVVLKGVEVPASLFKYYDTVEVSTLNDSIITTAIDHALVNSARGIRYLQTLECAT